MPATRFRQQNGDVRPRRRLHALGTWCARHFAVVLVLWLAALAGAQVAQHSYGGTYSDDFDLPGTPSQQGLDVLRAHAPASGGVSSTVVVHDADEPLTASAGAMSTAVGGLGKLDHVLAVQNPLPAGPGAPPTGAVSKDGHIGYITVRFGANPTSYGDSYLNGVDHAVRPLRQAGLQVEYGGPLGELARPSANDLASEGIGFGVAVVVLLLAFGSVPAALAPLVVSLIAVLFGLACLHLLASAFTFATVAPTLATMIGLGVGIDYALFLLTRHRQLVLDGVPPAEAAGRSVSTSGRAVLVSACTVVIALSGLTVSGVGFIGKLGAAAAVTVVTACLAALTLTPALLGLAGRRIDRYHVREPLAEAPSAGETAASGPRGWHRYALRVERRPLWFLAGGVVVVAVLAIPLFFIRLGHIDDGADPTSFTDRKAFDLLSEGFGPGQNGPLTVVVDQTHVPQQQRSALADQASKALTGVPGAARVTPPQPTGDGDVLVATVIPRGSPQDAGTTALVKRLKSATLPRAVAGTPAEAYVTGTTAAQVDFSDIITDRLPLIIATVVGLAFVIVLIVFRGILVALKAAVLNLLSIAASYGVVVAVFQWGWGGPELGVHGKVPIESYVPMMMFAIVFGLSMDYEIFLLTRVREAWLRTGDSHDSVAHALEITARVISSAAFIMVSVFAAFLISQNIVVKMLGLGLAVSVLIDATVVRLLLVPAVMTLLGRTAWWTPRWLDRVLPHLDPEGA